MNRRGILTAAIAAPVAIAAAHLPVEAGALRDRFAALSPEDQGTVLQFIDRLGAETPIMTLYREWNALYQYLGGEAAEVLSQADFDVECDRRIEMEDRVIGMPVVGPSDFAAKVLILTNHGDHELPSEEYCPELWAEARALAGAA